MRLVGKVLAVAAAVASLAGTAVAQEEPPYRVLAFGDSYGSGEGAPGTPGSYSPDGIVAIRRAVWSGSADDRAFTGDVETGLTGARRCHRSPLATAPRAAKILQTRFPDVAISFRSFACSGAQINTGVVGGYRGIEEDDGTNPDADDPALPPQLAQANTYLSSLPSGARADALVMNIGGNNLGFAKIIQKCTELPAGVDPCSPAAVSDGGGNDDAKDLFETGRGADEPESEIGLDDLQRHLRYLDGAVRARPNTPPQLARGGPRSITLTSPPNVLGGGFDGCAGLRGDHTYENRLRADERRWLEGTLLDQMVGGMRTAADDLGWDFVDMRPAFANGICGPSGRGINQNSEALPLMGDLGARFGAIQVSSGWVHPSPAGFAAMAPLLADRMQPRLIERFTPGGAPTTVTPVEQFALASRVALRFAGPAVDHPVRPAARLTATAPLAVGALRQAVLELRTTTPDHVARTVSTPARTCGPVGDDAAGAPRGCSAAQRDVTVLTGTPGRPAAPRVVRTGRDTLRVTWAPSAGAPPLRRFVVEVERVTPAGASGPRFDPACAFTGPGGTDPGEPSTNQTGCVAGASGQLPPLRYSMDATLRSALVPSGIGNPRVTVYECTDRGCGAASAPTTAPSTITPTFAKPTTLQLQQAPLGVVGAQVRGTVRSGRRAPLVVGWRAWKGWRNLRTITVELRDARAGALATLRLSPKTGRVVVTGRGARSRSTTTRGRRAVTSGPVRFDARRARLWRTERSAAFTLPVALRGRGAVDVLVGATSVGGKVQRPRQAARFTLKG